MEEKKKEINNCERCGTEVIGGLTPSIAVLCELRDNKKAAHLTAEARQLLEMTIGILSKRSFVLCLRCQREFARILGNPPRLFVPYQEFDRVSAAKDFAQALMEREKEQRKREEKNMREWLERLVKREVRTDEVEFIDLKKINESTFISCSVPGCGVKARPCDTSVKGKPLLANVSIQLVLCKDGRVVVEGGETVLTRKRIVPLCLQHAHQAMKISEKCGKGWKINYYSLLDTIRSFRSQGSKLGDLPSFQEVKKKLKPILVKK